MKKQRFIAGLVCLFAIVLIAASCSADIAELGSASRNSNFGNDVYKAVPFTDGAMPLVFGTSSSVGQCSVTVGNGTTVTGGWEWDGAAGSEIIPRNTIEVRSINGRGKVAGSEEGMAFYFREVSVNTNFKMTADFEVKSFGARPQFASAGYTDRDGLGKREDTDVGGNGQEAFGIMVRDFVPELPGYTLDQVKTIIPISQSSTAYRSGSGNGDSNMIMVGGVKRGMRVYWREGIRWNPAIPLTRGESGNPTEDAYMDATNFRFNFKPRELGDYSIYKNSDGSKDTLPARPDFPTWGSTWTITLEKNNSGFKYRIVPKDDYYYDPEELDSSGNPVRKSKNSVDSAILGDIRLYDICNSVNKDNYYVGLFAARDACVWVTNIEYYEASAKDCAPPKVFLPDLLTPDIQVVSPSVYTGLDYLYVTSNVKGKLLVTQNGKSIPSSLIYNEWIVEKQNGAAIPRTLFTIPTYPMKSEGDYIFSLAFYPGDLPAELANSGPSGVQLESKASITKTFVVTKKLYAGGTGDIYAGPHGSSNAAGTAGSPLDLQTAVHYVQPGQTIKMLDGIYYLEKTLSIPRYNNGTANAPKKLMAINRDKVFLDWRNAPEREIKGQGFSLDGAYWKLDGFHIRNTPDKVKGMKIGGQNNTVSWIYFYNNGDTGCQISGESSEPVVFWPSGNTIEYCESFSNRDRANTDADGFAAKLTVGKDNVFNYCIGHNNVDDCWDLFTKKDTGPIGIVKLYGCIAYEAGVLFNGEHYGTSANKASRNGFKMGGEGISIRHETIECLAFGNDGNAFTSNSNPSLDVFNCTAINFEKDGLGDVNIYTGESAVRADGKIENTVYTYSYRESGATVVVNEGGIENDDYDYQSILVCKPWFEEFMGTTNTYKHFLERDAQGVPILNNVFKSDTPAKGAWVFYQ